jgi:homocysteine S-methyltransferase
MTATGMPRLGGSTMLTDSGLETDLIFHRGWELPDFASFPLLTSEVGRTTLEQYYREHVDVAVAHGTGFVFETATWRASGDWGTRLGYAPGQLDEINRDAVGLVTEVRDSSPSLTFATVSGNLGPRGDGYVASVVMTAEEARVYHGRQIQVFADAGCDLVTVLTLNYAAEGLGIALAAQDAGVPVVLSFTLETDGTLPDGSHLGEVVESIDDSTDGYVSYFGINCAHPDHIAAALSGAIDAGGWTARIGALRANASRQSHSELDVATTIDDGDPEELASDYAALRSTLSGLTVFGGCCGTDVRHVRAIADVVAPV